jgi:hypothetical protein
MSTYEVTQPGAPWVGAECHTLASKGSAFDAGGRQLRTFC